MIIELDDFGANHVISDQTQSRDCRDALLELKRINPDFKVTLFSIPFEMTLELLTWAKENSDWVSLGLHGLRHTSNYECQKWTYDDMDYAANLTIVKNYFDKVFRAPGWQISDGCYKWLLDNDWIVCDQDYNDHRRPRELKVYKVGNNWHGHAWDVGWNGIYEDFEGLSAIVKDSKDFQFIKELF